MTGYRYYCNIVLRIYHYKILYTCYHLWATAKTSAIGTPFWGRTSWFSIFFKHEVSHESFPDSNIRGERDGTFPNLCPFQSPWVHPCFTGISKSAAAKHGTPAISQIFLPGIQDSLAWKPWVVSQFVKLDEVAKWLTVDISWYIMIYIYISIVNGCSWGL